MGGYRKSGRHMVCTTKDCGTYCRWPRTVVISAGLWETHAPACGAHSHVCYHTSDSSAAALLHTAQPGAVLWKSVKTRPTSELLGRMDAIAVLLRQPPVHGCGRGGRSKAIFLSSGHYCSRQMHQRHMQLPGCLRAFVVHSRCAGRGGALSQGQAVRDQAGQTHQWSQSQSRPEPRQ